MSNPAVIKLQSGRIGKSKIWLDDNFGESIHIHIDDNRVDLTVEEFRQLYDDLCVSLTKLVDVDGFDVSQIDPVFLSVMLWPYLPHLTGYSIETVNLGELYAPYHSYIYRLKNSKGYKALKTGIEIKEKRRNSQLLNQTESQRMNDILKSIKENGYPHKCHYIVVYGNDNIIRDGQHRASCLYYLYGNIDVPILRLKFDNYKSPDISNLCWYNMMTFVKKRMVWSISFVVKFKMLTYSVVRFFLKRFKFAKGIVPGKLSLEMDETMKAMFLSK